MNKTTTLPAVIMAINAIGSLPLASPVNASAADRAVGQATVMPIVAMHTAKNEAISPSRLDTFASNLALTAAMPPGMEPTRCGTISGSGYGWDDSRQDC